VSKQKQQGTSHESWIVKAFQAIGLNARRLAEGGSTDEGDVETFIGGRRWVLEGKARQNLNVQTTLGKARKKAGGDTPVAVIWKRLVRVAGYKVRQPVEGERIVVVLGWDDFINLVQNTQLPEGTVSSIEEYTSTITDKKEEEV
jgi:hypothetical protein